MVLFRTLLLPLFMIGVAACPALAAKTRLPTHAPLPEQAERAPEPKAAPAESPDAPATPPVPTERPDPAKRSATPAEPEQAAGEQKAEPPATDKDKKGEDDGGDAKDRTFLPDPRSMLPMAESLPADAKACRARLQAAGVTFKEAGPSRSDAAGCALPFPVEIESFGKEAEVEPGLLVTCGLAETAAAFITGSVKPLASSVLGKTLVGIDQASGYVCRPRNGTRKLSEHAFGNAFDISGFRFSDGSTLTVENAREGKDKAFLDAVRKAACGPFTTVLGPGSDADHANHLHLDRAIRRAGTTICE